MNTEDFDTLRAMCSSDLIWQGTIIIGVLELGSRNEVLLGDSVPMQAVFRRIGGSLLRDSILCRKWTIR